MNHWALMLADAPARLQLLIARRQRISLPRGADATTRVQCLRQALCHAATVRAVYDSLDTPLQVAVHELRQRQRGIARAELEQRYGSLRSWRALALDPRPRTISEHLVLLGWLLPRPASHLHPTRWLLPPELRRWLPQLLQLESHGPATCPARLPAALRASHSLILAAAQGPLDVHSHGLRASQYRLLSAYLHHEDTDQEALFDFVLPLLCDLGILVSHHGHVRASPAADAFLALPAAAQLACLQKSWLASARPDRILIERGMRLDGIDWPALRRRICTWIAALPTDQIFNPAALYSALSATFGPLANTHTHGFRCIDRMPWQPARAEAIFQRAIHGPLHWLGYIAYRPQGSGGADQGSVFRPSEPCSVLLQPWQYASDGKVLIPAGQSIDLLMLLPFVYWQTNQDDWLCYQISPSSLAQAQSRGYPLQRLQQLLDKHAGPLPPDWEALLDSSNTSTLHIANGLALVADQPGLLSRLSQDRSLRRLLDQRIAPGVALLAPAQLPRLERQLARQGIVLDMPELPSVSLDTAHMPANLAPGDAAALLVACHYYRQHAGAQAILLISAGLEAMLANALTPTLRDATRQTIMQLCPDAATEPSLLSVPSEPTPLPALVQTLRRSIQRQQTLRIAYDSGGLGRWEQRSIRPLGLELRYDTWYLRAYCLIRQAERTFRLDRMADINHCHAVTR